MGRQRGCWVRVQNIHVAKWDLVAVWIGQEMFEDPCKGSTRRGRRAVAAFYSHGRRLEAAVVIRVATGYVTMR